MNTKVVSTLLVTALSLGVSNARAAGFGIGAQDARSNAMTNAFAAVADNASAAWYNPSATVFLEGKNNVSVGSMFVNAKLKHTNTAVNGGVTDETKDIINVLPHLYAVHKLNDNQALSLSVNVPFGLSSHWKEDAQTAGVALESEVQDINFNVNYAYKFSDKFSAALGLNYGSFAAKLTNSFSDIDADKGDGYGWNAALTYKPVEDWTFATTYRSRMTATLHGGKFKTKPAGASFPVEADLTVPDMFTAAASWRMNDKWLFSLQGDYTNWTTYDKLVFKLSGAPFPNPKQVKGFKQGYAARVGTKYILNDKWKISGGLTYDANPVPTKYFETRVPDSDRIEVGIGATYEVNGSFAVDFSYCRVQFLTRDVKGSHATGNAFIDATIDGTYRSYADMPAVTLSYKF